MKNLNLACLKGLFIFVPVHKYYQASAQTQTMKTAVRITVIHNDKSKI